MKKIIFLSLFLFSCLTFAQDYENNWVKVIIYENNGKIKSAATEVDKIYKKSKVNKNEVQTIKCFFYKSKYIQILEEEAQSKIISNIKKEINESTGSSKAILNLIYARCLNNYYKENNYKIRRRTIIDSSETKNFLTWSSLDFEKEIDLIFQKTLIDESTLKNTPIRNYEPIFDFFSKDKFIKTSLFTYLLQANIDYYSTMHNERELNSSNYKSIAKYLLGNQKEFNNLKFDSIKSPNIKKTLELYQKLETNETSFEPELDRILFCNKYITKSNTELIKSLELLQKRNNETLLFQKIVYEKANLYKSLANKENHSNYNLKAIMILDSILSIENKSNTFKKAKALKQQINLKDLNIQFKKNSYENENTRAFISYKNVNSIVVSFYKINNRIQGNFQKEYIKKDSIQIDYIKKNQALTVQKYNLKNADDYFNHTTEVLLPKLEKGIYLVCFENENFDNSSKTYSFETIQISNLILLNSTEENKTICQVVNRKTGKPIENCSIENSKFNLSTNDKGIAFFENKDNTNDFSAITLIKDNDTLTIENKALNRYYYPKKDKKEKYHSKVNFYLDRAIYRPGQTVYYKGIATKKIDDNTSIFPNLKIKIIINDANYKEFKSFEVTTNEFGSFSGEFNLPRNGLTGNFSIQATIPNKIKTETSNILFDEYAIWDEFELDYSIENFKVEEYKRPKFEASFDAIKESYFINQTIKVKGNAKSFSGSSVTNAKVSYEIVRETYSSWKEPYSDDEEIIVEGETKTDGSGNFEIAFLATPDDSYEKDELPIFSYKIEADITDINGETHSTSTKVRVGYQSLVLEATINAKINTKDKNFIYLNSSNLNNQFVATKGEIKMYFINKLENKFKNRTWSKPEIETISKLDFEKLFPYEITDYVEKSDSILVYSKIVNTEKDKKIELDFIKKYKSGNYRMVFSVIDKFNNQISTSNEFELHQSNDKFSFGSEIIKTEQLNENPKKDGFVDLKITSNVPILYLSITGNYIQTTFYKDYIKIENNERIIRIPFSKKYKNSFAINIETYFEEQFFYSKKDIYLLEEIPQITIETESFRDKIQPGSIENWSFNIKDSNAKESEILASMYDSSLDQFEKKDWNYLNFNRFHFNNFNRTSVLGDAKIYKNINNLNPKINPIEYQNEYTKLMWFGFDFNRANNPYLLKEYKKQITKKATKPLNSKLITGYVSDSSGPLPGANVIVKGTVRGTQTNLDGYYEIEASKDEILVFSFLGMNDYSAEINSNNINVTLEYSSSQLDEVVVLAYGIESKKAAVNSSIKVGIVASDNLAKSFNEDETIISGKMAAELQGQLAGLEVSNNSTTKIMIRGLGSIDSSNMPIYVIDGKIVTSQDFASIDPNSIYNISILKKDAATSLYGNSAYNGVILITTKKSVQDLFEVKARKNLDETAFFFPHLKTDSNGKVNLNFTSPEALTKWKLRLFAHNKNAISGYLEKNIITQKEIMVTPNFPRFFREKDSLTITSKISNITKELKKGIAVLQLFDASTMESIDVKSSNTNTVKNFSITAFGNTTVSWKIIIPEGLQGIQYKVLAKSGDYSDGEMAILPVLTNSILVTESIPIWVRDNSKKEYTFANLKNNTSNTLRHHQITLEYTSNPTWIAIQSLPYLMEYEHECAEQTFSRFYSNALATDIINSNPKIVTLFDSWKTNGKLNSKLEENEELKSLILAETPWLNDAQNEIEKKTKLALLFDLEKMKSSQNATFDKLKQKQNPSGGFVWFTGGNESDYITRHILCGFGHLKKLNIASVSKEKIKEISNNGIPFIDKKFLEVHKNLVDYQKKYKNWNWANPYTNLHYLYTRSFYLDDYPMPDELKKVIPLYIESSKKNWLTYSLYEKALTAIIMNRFGETTTANKIVESLKETSSNNEDWGMYWIENKSSWYWYQAPIETQALLIEAFSEITNDIKSVDAMKVWLLKNKQTKNWPTTKSTTEAIYALLLQGTDWLSVKDNTIIKIGDEKIATKKLTENEKEAETGYLKLNWKASEIKPEMAAISIENKSKVPGLGGVYWQYFEDLDKIKSNSGATLSTSKELYVKKNTKGQELQRINEKTTLQIGNLVTVRLIITAKEDVEYIHLKDMRASCFEPVNVLSEYKWKDGLGFYMSTKDAATHFFFDKINKGTYIIEYDIRINNSGNFSNGITTIESMYAPEFTSHTKGIRLNVKE